VTSAAPDPADPEVAAAVFADHLNRVRVSTQARDHGWTFTCVDPLHAVVAMSASRANGTADPYHLLLGAEFYDLHPPTVMFVSPVPSTNGWREAGATSRWMPVVSGLNWFAVHPNYQYPGQEIDRDIYTPPRQLVCCSMILEYYISNHSPTDGQRWQQGRHTLGGTLARIQEALTSPQYQGPAGADDS
jgi:hypothetical protein